MLVRVGGILIDEPERPVLVNVAQEKVRRDDVQGKDILSVLARACLATDLPKTERSSDDAILVRASSFRWVSVTLLIPCIKDPGISPCSKSTTPHYLLSIRLIRLV